MRSLAVRKKRLKRLLDRARNEADLAHYPTALELLADIRSDLELPLPEADLELAEWIAAAHLETCDPKAPDWTQAIDLAGRAGALPAQRERAIAFFENWRRNLPVEHCLDQVPKLTAKILLSAIDLFERPESALDANEARKKHKALLAGSRELARFVPDLVKFYVLWRRGEKKPISATFRRELDQKPAVAAAVFLLNNNVRLLGDVDSARMPTPRGECLTVLAQYFFGTGYWFRLLDDEFSLRFEPLLLDYADFRRARNSFGLMQPSLDNAVDLGDLEAIQRWIDFDEVDDLECEQAKRLLGKALAGFNSAIETGNLGRASVYQVLANELVRHSDLPMRSKTRRALIQRLEDTKMRLGSLKSAPFETMQARGRLLIDLWQRLNDDPADPRGRAEGLYLAREICREPVFDLRFRAFSGDDDRQTILELARLFLMRYAEQASEDAAVGFLLQLEAEGHPGFIRDEISILISRYTGSSRERLENVWLFKTKGLQPFLKRIHRDLNNRQGARGALLAFIDVLNLLAGEQRTQLLTHFFESDHQEARSSRVREKDLKRIIAPITRDASSFTLVELVSLLSVIRQHDFDRMLQRTRRDLIETFTAQLDENPPPNPPLMLLIQRLSAACVTERHDLKQHALREVRRYIGRRHQSLERIDAVWQLIAQLEVFRQAFPAILSEITHWQNTFLKSIADLERESLWGVVVEYLLMEGKIPIDQLGRFLNRQVLLFPNEPVLTAVLLIREMLFLANFSEAQRLLRQCRQEFERRPIDGLGEFLERMRKVIDELLAAERMMSSPFLQFLDQDLFEDDEDDFDDMDGFDDVDDRTFDNAGGGGSRRAKRPRGGARRKKTRR